MSGDYENTELPRWLSVSVDMTAAAVTHVFHHPLYTLKTHMQNKNFSFLNFFNLTRQRHVRFLFSGVVVRTFFVMPEKMLKLQAFKMCLHDLQKKGYSNKVSLLLAGSVGGAVTTIINCPSELVMVQAQANDRRLKDVLKEKKKLHRSYLRGIYTGFWPSVSRDIAFNGAFFLVRYWGIEKYETYYNCTCNDSSKFWIGAVAGCVGGTLACPFDVAKTRSQANVNQPFFLRTMYDIIKHEGAHKLFSGLSTRLMILPSMMSLLVVVQERLERWCREFFSPYLQQQVQ